jgi:hypothetical protein
MAWEVCFDDSRRVLDAHWSIHLSTHKQTRLGLQQSDPHLGPFNRTVCQEERSPTILFLGFCQCINSLPISGHTCMNECILCQYTRFASSDSRLSYVRPKALNDMEPENKYDTSVL